MKNTLILCLGMMIFLWISSMVAKSPDNQQETIVVSNEMIMPDNQMKFIIGILQKKFPVAQGIFPKASWDSKFLNHHSGGKKKDLVSQRCKPQNW